MPDAAVYNVCGNMRPKEKNAMDINDRVARIEEMEEALTQAATALLGFEQDLDDFEAAQPVIKKLSDYYGSVDWFEDRDADEEGKLPDDLERGVLGEDLAYDLLVGYHDIAIRMMEVAMRALKD